MSLGHLEFLNIPHCQVSIFILDQHGHGHRAMSLPSQALKREDQNNSWLGIVFGLGLTRVGLPLAVEFANAGFSVTLLVSTCKNRKVEGLNAASRHVKDVPSAEYREVRKQFSARYDGFFRSPRFRHHQHMTPPAEDEVSLQIKVLLRWPWKRLPSTFTRLLIILELMIFLGHY